MFKNSPFSIRLGYRDWNLRLLNHESPPITTRPGRLPPTTSKKKKKTLPRNQSFNNNCNNVLFIICVAQKE